MKLDFVEFAGFRGFRKRTRFELPAGFTVVTGRNGAGKSTLFDAIDFALTGSINKYSVSSARGGGLADHIWWMGEGNAAEHYVTVGFISDLGERFAITRTRDTGADWQPEMLLSKLCRPGASRVSIPELMQTTLVRDELISALSLDLPEQARFAAVRSAIGAITGPDQSARTEAVLRSTRALLEAENLQASQLQGELGRVLTALTEARSEAERSSDVAEAMRVIEDSTQTRTDLPRAEAVRAEIADRRAKLSQWDAALKEADTWAQEFATLGGQDFKAQVEAAERVLQAAKTKVGSFRERANSAARVAKEGQIADAEVAHLAALVEHGEAIGLQGDHCPLCAASRTEEQFRSAIAAMRERLAESGRRYTSVVNAAEHARSSLTEALGEERQAQLALDELRARIAAADLQRERLRSMFGAGGLTNVNLDDLEQARREVNAARQSLVELERAQRVLDTSNAADRVASLEARLVELRTQTEATAAKVAESERAVETARQIDVAAKSIANEILVEQFETVMPLLKELYRRLRPHTDWTEIDSDFGGKVRGTLNFTVGDGRNPQFLFSSGQRRAAGLAFLLSTHLSRPWCLWRSVLMDDPVQHVDDYRALNLVEVLSAIRRSGRQVVVAVEDPSLADLLCRRLRGTASEPGRRYELGGGEDGAAVIQDTSDIPPMPAKILNLAAS